MDGYVLTVGMTANKHKKEIGVQIMVNVSQDQAQNTFLEPLKGAVTFF